MSVALCLEEVPEDPEDVQGTFLEAEKVLRAATGNLNHPQTSDHVKCEFLMRAESQAP